MFIGVELVRDRKTKKPATDEADIIINRMQDKGILISTDGPLHNVLKIKPPMVFNKDNVKYFAKTLNQVLKDFD